MNTKLRFKLIALLISLSLLGLLVSQGYWLKGLYNTTWETTEKNVRDAMIVSDYKELFFRIEKLKSEGFDFESQSYRMNTNNFFENEVQPEEDVNKEDFNFVAEPLSLKSYTPMELLTQLQELVFSGIHSYVDSVKPISYKDYYQILSEELEERGIYNPYVLRVIEQENAYFQYESSVEINLWKKYIYFDHPVPGFPEQTYRLYIKSPEKIVLGQMAGILISSFFLILLVIIAFIYLLRTILRQKTIEELKTDFTNNVTHELKTPIAVAYAANDALLNYDNSVNDKQKKYLTIIKEQLNYLTGMVEQILTLSVENRSTFRLNPESIKISSLLPSLFEQHKLKAKKNLIFSCHLPDDFTVTADRTHLYNMLNNLIENAIKYSDKEPVEITISAIENNKEKQISVKDNGIGISEEYQKYIFDKFFRVPQGNRYNVKGYGLGLFYIKDLMNKHEGAISVKSLPGEGSVFTLHFRK